MIIKKAYKFKLIPSKKQDKILSSWTGACRYLYNVGLEHRTLLWSQYKKSINYYDQQNILPEIKKMEGYVWLRELPSQSLQYAFRNLDTAFKNFFERRASYPQFKKKGIHDSISFPQGERFVINQLNNRKSVVLLPKIGGIKFIQHREIKGNIKLATIRRECGDWYISFQCELEKESKIIDGWPIGIDRGTKKTLAFSNGEHETIPIDNIKTIEKRIEKLQRRKSKEKLYSDGWNKYNKIINKLHGKISRIRHNWLHVQSYRLTNNHGVIVVEDLKVKNMSKSAKGTIENPGKNVKAKSGLNRSILRQGWGMFVDMLQYKSLWYGSHIEKVPPMYTSQECSCCGYISESNRVSQSEFVCQRCTYKENADINAAKNILRLGLQSLGLTPQEAPAIA